MAFVSQQFPIQLFRPGEGPSGRSEIRGTTFTPQWGTTILGKRLCDSRARGSVSGTEKEFVLRRTHDYKMSSNETPAAPQCVRESRPIVVGGGPVGMVTAAMLHFRGVEHISLIESVKDYKRLPPTRCYALNIADRGYDALKIIPGLQEVIDNNISPSYGRKEVKFDGTLKSSSFKSYAPTFRYIMRTCLLELLKKFLHERTTVATYYGHTVQSVRYLPDGIQVDVEREGQIKTLHSHLVFAADGRNSTVVSSLLNADTNMVNSTRGFGTSERLSASVGLKVKSVMVEVESLHKAGLTSEDLATFTTTFESAVSSNPARERVKLELFPTPASVIKEMGGVLGIMVNPARSSLWDVETVEEFYSLLELNFPQLNIREAITQEQVQVFLKSNADSFPPITRVDSLTGDTGDDNGVVILGDAAHSFPPDAELGLNSGFEDVALFAATLDSQSQHDSPTLRSILNAYEIKNDQETDALVYVARVASPYRYGNAPIRRQIHMAYVVFRSILEQQFPSLFDVTLNVSIFSKMPYTEMVRRDNQSTRILAVAAACALLGGAIWLYNQVETFIL